MHTRLSHSETTRVENRIDRTDGRVERGRDVYSATRRTTGNERRAWDNYFRTVAESTVALPPGGARETSYPLSLYRRAIRTWPLESLLGFELRGRTRESRSRPVYLRLLVDWRFQRDVPEQVRLLPLLVEKARAVRERRIGAHRFADLVSASSACLRVRVEKRVRRPKVQPIILRRPRSPTER